MKKSIYFLIFCVFMVGTMYGDENGTFDGKPKNLSTVEEYVEFHSNVRVFRECPGCRSKLSEGMRKALDNYDVFSVKEQEDLLRLLAKTHAICAYLKDRGLSENYDLKELPFKERQAIQDMNAKLSKLSIKELKEYVDTLNNDEFIKKVKAIKNGYFDAIKEIVYFILSLPSKPQS